MVLPAFGWSTGDLLETIKIIYELSKGFREIGGAEDQFQLSSAWLECFGHDLTRVKEFIEQNPEASCNPGLQEKLLLIRSSYTKFTEYIKKYNMFLPAPATRDRRHWTSGVRALKKASQTMKWAWKELDNHVDELRQSVSFPLAEMNLVLLLHICGDFHKLSDQCAAAVQRSDLSEIKEILQEQKSSLNQLITRGNEIITAVNRNKEMSILEEAFIWQFSERKCRGYERLALICGHFDPAHCPEAYAKASQLKESSETRLKDADTRLAHLLETGNEATERILRHLDSICSSFNSFADRTTEIEVLQKETNQINCDLQEIHEGLERTENRIQEVGAQQAIWAGVSLAATTTSVVGLMSILFQNKWESLSPVTSARLKAFATPSPTISFEVKWAEINAKWNGKSTPLPIRTSFVGSLNGKTTPTDVDLSKHFESRWNSKECEKGEKPGAPQCTTKIATDTRPSPFSGKIQVRDTTLTHALSEAYQDIAEIKRPLS